MNTDKALFVHHFLEHSAQRFPEKEAVIFQKQRLTYREIDNSANALAWKLHEMGAKTGDRVLLLLENRPEYVISYYGIMKAGAVAVPVNTDIKPVSLGWLIKDTGAKILISSSAFYRVLNDFNFADTDIGNIILFNPKTGQKDFGIPTINWDEAVLSNKTSSPAVVIENEAPASIIYTSGSTGNPKGVVLSHRNIVSNTRAICASLELTDADIQMVVLPFFYVMGKSLLNTHFAVGGTVVINNTFLYPATVLKQMSEEKVTGFSGVPSTYAFLLHRSPLASYRDQLPHLRYCSQAGGHMSKAIKVALRNVLPEHTKIFVMYGATEASARLTYLDPRFYEAKMDSVGKPVLDTTIQIVDDDGKPVPAGVEGELVASGPGIMRGYWNNPEATAEVLDETGYHTGDLGYIDEDGFIYIKGRKDNQLKVGGNRINTQEIEDLILETGLVVEAFVTGIPDAMLGNKLVAVVVATNKQTDVQEILSACTRTMPKYKIPQTMLLAPSLPKKISGKIDKNACMELLSKQNSNESSQYQNNNKGSDHEQH
jgi:acyl-CoA synthetase (AMP-forming)/AMP-acid ligase II